MSFLTAIRFLTAIPLPFKNNDSAESMGRSTAFFPAVGLIIGMVLAGLNLLFRLILPPPLVNALLIVSLVLITGAMHLDGLADTCDGMAGNKSAEDRWKVMHDSRSGAFGITGIALVLLVKYASLNCIPGNLITMSLLMMPVLSRWAMTYAIIAFPYARPEGLGKPFNTGISRWRFVTATLTALAVTVAAGWFAGLAYYWLAGPAIMLAVWVIIWLVSLYFKWKFSGLTGDTYGAINETAEVSTLILINILAFFG